jgi:hypothetical protein
MKLNEQNEVTCYACMTDDFNTIPAGTLLSGPADNLSNGQVPGAPEGTYCDFTVQWGDESWQVGYIGGTTDNTWDQIVNCGQPEEEDICDNFENSIPVSVSAFCTKCETNSWVGSEFEQYCGCCPAGQPDPEGMALPDKGKKPLNKKSKKPELKESVIKRLQKLAGLK